jgi:mRNA (guanine-N7-)-methyltransferase
MPYPLDTPICKHDLFVPKVVLHALRKGIPPPNISNEIGLTTSVQFFEEIASSPEKVARDKENIHFQRISSIYTYSNDTPQPPLARTLYVLGVADTSLSVVRKLGLEDVDDDEYDKSILHKCTVAVKRIDGSHGAQLPSGTKQDCMNFANFIGLLHSQQLLAVIGPADKHGRISFLQSNSDYTPGENSSTTISSSPDNIQNFAALVFVGTLDKIKQYMSSQTNGDKKEISQSQNGPSRKRQRNEESDVPNEDDLWRPGDNNENTDVDDGLWKPPGSDETNNDTSLGDEGLWQPPGSDSIDNNDYSTTNGGINNHSTFQDTGNYKDEGNINEFHADSGAAAADRFYSKLTRTLETRADSRLYHMRAFNGWVKGTQIQELNPQTSVKIPNQGKRKQNQTLTNQPLRVLDLACGKGGDLGKWTMHSRGIANYVGIDVARGSLVDAAIRARKMTTKFLQQKCVFTCADLGSDVPGRYKSSKSKHLQKLSSWSLANESKNLQSLKTDPVFKMERGGGISLEDKFDVVSIQFAIHYMMQTRRRARRFFQTVAQLLEVGGNLIATTIDARVVMGHLLNLGCNLHPEQSENSNEPVFVTAGEGACRIRFESSIVQKILHSSSAISDVKAGSIHEDLFGLEYTFTLVEGSDHASGVGDAVNLPEWLIPVPVLQALGEEVGLELVYAQNFHEFYNTRSDPSEYSALHSTMYNMKVLNMSGSISQPEWEISRLYVAVKFKKVRDVTEFYNDDDDDDNDEVVDDESDDANNTEEDDTTEKLPEVDPVLKGKLYLAALMKVKALMGTEIWNTLSTEAKNKLTDAEIHKMILNNES